MIDLLVSGIAGWWVAGVGLVAFSMYDRSTGDFALWERELEGLEAHERLSERAP